MRIHFGIPSKYDLLENNIGSMARQVSSQDCLVGRDLTEPVKGECFKVKKVRFRQKKRDLSKESA